MAAWEDAPPSRKGARAHPHGGGGGRARDALVFAAGAAAAVVALLVVPSVLGPAPGVSLPAAGFFPAATGPEAAARTFYDDPELAYTVDRRVTGWDAKRARWLRSRGLLRGATAPERVVMVSGSRPEPCPGDHLLLRFLKNKLDYCRLHGVELFYNRALLQPDMNAYWAKIPVVRAAMLAHPEAEWVWWVDADAVFTDMDFSLPLAKYAGHNLVVYGWHKEVYEVRSWVGLNAGVFLIRNCQWSLDLMDEWARMGPASPEYARWGKTLKDTLSNKPDAESDDQSALVYLLLKNSERWGNKTYIETDYYFQGYWAEIVDRLDGVAARYQAVERGDGAAAAELRRRHAEREHLQYAARRNAAVREAVPGPDGGGQSGWRRPFVTHFTGCQPCDGKGNPAYSWKSCHDGIRRALDFADDQVLRAYGFRHAAPLDDAVVPLPFDYPAKRAGSK
ncbi:hypothetical protein ACP70R_008255 [Stipagrostis hirtigluma subsp. patula]